METTVNNFISPKVFWKTSDEDLYTLDRALSSAGALKLIPVKGLPGFTWAISKLTDGYKREVWDACGNKLPIEFCKSYTEFSEMLEAALNGARFCKRCGKTLLPLMDVAYPVDVVSVCCEDCFAECGGRK